MMQVIFFYLSLFYFEILLHLLFLVFSFFFGLAYFWILEMKR